MTAKEQVEIYLNEHGGEFESIPQDDWDCLIGTISMFRELVELIETDANHVEGRVRVLALALECHFTLSARSASGRVDYKKPSAQTRYARILHHVYFEVVSQYAQRNGFARRTDDGAMEWEDFDLDWHSERIFTPDADLRVVHERWNELNPSDAIPKLESFRKTCQRALDEQEPSLYRDLLARVVAPGYGAHAADLPARQRDDELFLAHIRCLRDYAELQGLRNSDWPAITSAYNAFHGTSHTLGYLKQKYYRLKSKARGQESEPQPFSGLSDILARRCPTPEAYLAELHELGQVLKDRAAQDEPDAAK